MSKPVDVALIGGGIMSATLGVILKRLEPDWDIQIFERLGDVAMESSNAWNNAGTGHAALCELNYTPQKADGSIDIAGAVKVNEQFQVSRQLWAYLVKQGALPQPSAFITPTPHMSFVWGEANVEYLRRRYEAMKDHPLFDDIEFSDDARVIRSWAPLLIPGRKKSQPIAATRVAGGTDIDFGALAHHMTNYLVRNGATIHLEHRVDGLKRQKDGTWRIKMRRDIGLTPLSVNARFVFVGAGGYALNLLQKSRIEEIRGFGGFPVSGEFLRTDNQELVARHTAKVYGKASVGSPPMSVPHLDLRVVDGSGSLMFGPYAGFSPKFLKSGSWLDLFASIRFHNLLPMIAAGLSNLGLVRYLVGQLLARPSTKFEALKEFVPDGKPEDWYRITAGQRVQVIKKDPAKVGVLQFGTEVIAAADGSIAGLLGASPGASTAVPIMLGLIEKCFPDRFVAWKPGIKKMIPSFGKHLADNPTLARKTLASTAKVLGIPLAIAPVAKKVPIPTSHVVLTFAVQDVKRSADFYRDGLGFDLPDVEHGVLNIELPGMSLFLAEMDDFAKYSAAGRNRPYLPAGSVEGILSCAMDTRDEVDDVLAKASAAGAAVVAADLIRHESAGLQYIGSFTDPDGHLWQLVYNEEDLAPTKA